MSPLSRRKFVALTVSGMATTGSIASPLLFASRPAAAPTAGEVIDRIKAKLGGEREPDSSDGLKAGDLAVPVTGIVTTALASLQVLRDAVAAGANMVITSEPVFFSKADTPTPPVRRFPGMPTPPADAPPPKSDPVFTAKSAFIKDHNLVVYRLNEHWRAQQPDRYLTGFAAEMGWAKYAGAAPGQFTLPATPLPVLASMTKTKLGSRGGIRVVGDRRLLVKTVAFLPGSTPLQAALDALPHVDALIAGEVREWETVEYVRDTVDLGGRKALIYVGRIVSEEPGMRQCAAWLKSVVPEVPAIFKSAGDPYWRPQV